MPTAAGVSKGTLYVVGTPIGNLRDISLRALEVLSAVDCIAAEHVQSAQKLLAAHTVHIAVHNNTTHTRITPLHQHNEGNAAQKIIELLISGQSVALISDAGTPAISDPGALLVQQVRARNFPVVPIPGANAALCALSASGLIAPHFFFYGFLPAKSGERQRKLASLKTLYACIPVFYEAPHRVLECVADMVAVFGPTREITFARELTKIFETIHTCMLGEALDWLRADENRLRGEFVLLLAPEEEPDQEDISLQAVHTLAILQRDLPLKQAVQLAAEITGESRKKLYTRALLEQKTGM
ncbi:16S rRNA (cytidine1402-2'-O)-methyltransferase [Nitrosomonas eutropha]|uniref:16S rRNA (cytidine(1402)-2'-O)-methyltransferase n=1 Tax=Nitrosomonas TaxID=914 RepID=UPI000895CAF5|nr:MULTISPECIES: 16S rRNA (cytidine(1402)-2'-O)-methyltransferase [Nitrosomonas]MXS80401.1 16S rRNA (cytidine(1402)-2'-O)-methyltransferase [Nitrosomonas sp. GH22]SDW77706.1 16S rRNA (cytidine1402-2'-O)-methyltransferase [Nitrosomonas eutropha]